MKNVTITLPEEVARWARVQAAREGTSVSRMLGEILQQRMRDEEGYQSAMQQFLGRRPRKLKRAGSRYPRREQIHERE